MGKLAAKTTTRNPSFSLNHTSFAENEGILVMSGHQTTYHRPQSPPRRRRACLPCTKAKARCHYENIDADSGCDRCWRLKITCNPQTTKSLRRPRQVKASGNINISTISRQSPQQTGVNGLLWDSPEAVPDAIASGSLGSRQQLQEPNGIPGTRVVAGLRSDQSQKHYGIPHHSNPPWLGSSASHSLPSSPGFGLAWSQAEKAVDDFNTIFTAHFPFIILDHNVTAQQLFVEKPLLFRAILMTAIDLSSAKSREIQRSVDAWIGQHLLVMEEQSLGALQGLIVYIIWGNPHFYSDCRATQLMYFAVGLAHSLGITRQATADDTRTKKESDINEEHRAFLACYYILSFNSFQFGRPNPLASSYVQHCVDSIERSSEFQTDFLLIKLVKFRQFVGRIPTVYEGICDTKWCREISDDASDQLCEMRKDLDDFMTDISHKHPKMLLLWTLHHSALIQLHLPMTYAAPDSPGASRLQLECMRYCLQAGRKFASMVRSLSPDGFLYAPFTTLVDMISMLIAISRLLLVDVAGWDLGEARESIGFRTALDELLAKLETAGDIKAARVAAAAAENPSGCAPDGVDGERRDRLRVFVRLLESMKTWLSGQGVFRSGNEEAARHSTSDVLASPGIHVSPQSPRWNFTFFFDSLLQLREGVTS